jgi:ComF family protein
MDWTYRIAQWLWTGLDWLYPPVCGGCQQPGYNWCPDCQQQVTPVPEPLCRTCGLPQKKAGICSVCEQEPPPYTALRSWVAFEGPIRSALHRLKYRRNMALGDALSRPMSKFAVSLNWPVDTVVAVPLGQKRMQERGYNQVALVARPLAALNGWEHRSGALVRARETRSQVGLTAVERLENMRDAFRSDPRLVAGRTILIVDDVATTGATLTACSRALLASGAKAVYALTIARALPRHGLKIV